MYSLATSDGTYFANGVLVSNCDCLRYLAMYNPKYIKPPVGQVRAGSVYAAFQRKMQKKREQGGSKVWLGPRKAAAS